MRAEPYGCHNRELKSENVVRQVVVTTQAYRTSARPRDTVTETVFSSKVVAVPFRNTTDCQYTLSGLGRIDPGCHGCKWRKEP